MEGLLIVGAIFGSIAAMVIVPFWLKERTKQSAHKVIAEAVARGQPLDPAIMDQLTQAVGTKQQQSSPRRTLGNGIVLLALGIAFGVVDWFNNGHSWTGGGLEWPAMILGALGL